MEQLVDSYKKSEYLHHAYFLVGELEIIADKLLDFLAKTVMVKTVGNPDFYNITFRTLTVENARWIAELQSRKSFRSYLEAEFLNKKIFVIRAETITEEAQNALLKVIEEPAANTHFFIICPQDSLLSTVS